MDQHFRRVGSLGGLNGIWWTIRRAGLERESSWTVVLAFLQTALPTLTLCFFEGLWHAKACCVVGGQVALTGSTDSSPLLVSLQSALSFVYLTYV